MGMMLHCIICQSRIGYPTSEAELDWGLTGSLTDQFYTCIWLTTLSIAGACISCSSSDTRAATIWTECSCADVRRYPPDCQAQFGCRASLFGMPGRVLLLAWVRQLMGKLHQKLLPLPPLLLHHHLALVVAACRRAGPPCREPEAAAQLWEMEVQSAALCLGLVPEEGSHIRICLQLSVCWLVGRHLSR